MQMVQIKIFYISFTIGNCGHAPVQTDRPTDRACNEWVYYVLYCSNEYTNDGMLKF